MRKSQNLLLGEAGVYRVAAELLKRGINVMIPAIDDGIDLYTEKCRLQIKSASMQSDHFYRFNFKHWSERDGKRIQKYGHLHKEVSHVVLWGSNDDVFWIIPSKKLASWKLVTIGSPNKSHLKRKARKSHYEECLGAWHLITN